MLYTELINILIYSILVVVTLLPPLIGLKPFTYYFAKGKYPQAIVESHKFYRINLIINHIWALIFIFSLLFSVIHYLSNPKTSSIISIATPVLLMLTIGLPLTIKLPTYLMRKMRGQRIIFTTTKELFECMPFGFNKDLAKGVNFIIQFYLTGNEPTTGYLTVKNQDCFFNYGEHQNPETIIHCDSDLWLDISNQQVDGDIALINKMYVVEGQASVMLDFGELFSITSGESYKNIPEPIDYSYKTIQSKKIKNVVVFDGGARSDSYSKTTFMTNKFVEGLKSEGANVEYFKLKEYVINNCTGCYNCWTKTPGKCSVNDDMNTLLYRFREADLIVFASPLYVFSVTGIMKTFMDRIVPLLKPYMMISKDGNTMHPDRFPEKGEQGFVVFSAGGFPDIKNNFEGVKGIFRNLDSHGENLNLIGEFLLPASEMLNQAVYANRKSLIAETCIQAGKQIIQVGKIDINKMQLIQNPHVSKEKFKVQANAYWETLDGIQSYYKGTDKLDI